MLMKDFWNIEKGAARGGHVHLYHRLRVMS